MPTIIQFFLVVDFNCPHQIIRMGAYWDFLPALHFLILSEKNKKYFYILSHTDGVYGLIIFIIHIILKYVLQNNLKLMVCVGF